MIFGGFGFASKICMSGRLGVMSLIGGRLWAIVQIRAHGLVWNLDLKAMLRVSVVRELRNQVCIQCMSEGIRSIECFG
jgi:hypothetical protein